MANTAVTSGLGFIFWIVVARLFSEADVGLGSAIISVVTFLALISNLGLNIALIRFLPETREPVKMINSCLTTGGIAAIIISGIFIAGLGFWSPQTAFIRDSAIFILALITFTIFDTLTGIMNSVFIAMRRAEYVLIKNTIFSLLKIPLPILMSVYFYSFGIFSSWGLAVSIAVLTSLLLFIPRLQDTYRPVPSLNLHIIKDIWRYSAGNYFALLFAAAPSLILPILIVNLAGKEANAFFYVAWMIYGLLVAIPVAVSLSLFAEGAYLRDRLAINARRSFKFILILLIPAIILVVALGKWLLLLFGDEYSSNALRLLLILSASSLFVGVNYIYYTILRVRGRIGELMVIHGTVAIAVLVASGLIVEKHGIVSIGYIWICVEALLCIYVLLTVRLRYNVRLTR